MRRYIFFFLAITASTQLNAREFEGLISSNLFVDKEINQQLFVRSQFSLSEKTWESWEFFGEKQAEGSFTLYFHIDSYNGDNFQATFALKESSSLIYSIKVQGILYANNSYIIKNDGKPKLSIKLEIDKKFTEKEIMARALKLNKPSQ